jgi:hypothetical protein
MKIYKVNAARFDQWWSVEASVPRASIWTQARRIDQIEATVRDAIALALDVAPNSFAIDLNIEMPENLRDDVELARATTRISELAQHAATVARRVVALRLQEQGFTVRDIGQVLGLSSQRISQLISGDGARADDLESQMNLVRTQLADIKAQSQEVLPAGGKAPARAQMRKPLAKTG